MKKIIFSIKLKVIANNYNISMIDLQQTIKFTMILSLKNSKIHLFNDPFHSNFNQSHSNVFRSFVVVVVAFLSTTAAAILMLLITRLLLGFLYVSSKKIVARAKQKQA